jgi:cytidine kinase
MIQFVAFGLIIDDLVFPDGRTQMGTLGGGGVQTAWGMAVALGSGESVGLAAGVGNDLPENELAPLRAAGINLDGLRRTSHPTPRAWQILEEDGLRRQLWRTPTSSLGEQLAREWALLPIHYQAATHFHMGFHLEDGLPSLVHSLKERQKTVSLEPFRLPMRVLSDSEKAEIFQSCQIFSPNQEELLALFDTSLHEAALLSFTQSGGQYLVLRQGADGATIFDAVEHHVLRAPAFQTKVIDATGAGNAFCGALLARVDDGIESALGHAIVAASYMVEQPGIPSNLPDPADYTARLNIILPQITIEKF